MIAIKKLENQTFELITVITFIDNKTDRKLHESYHRWLFKTN